MHFLKGVALKFEKLSNLKKDEFHQIYNLLELSFPQEEYRSYEDQNALLDHSYYHIFVERDDQGEILAFVALWKFEEFNFLEHFATHPKARGKGIGSKIIKEITENCERVIFLEVEPPVSEVNRKRISFYERNGFYLNDFPYKQPALNKDTEEVPLMIMTTKGKIEEESFEKMKRELLKSFQSQKIKK